MIKLYSLKQHKKDGETPKSGNQKKASAAHLRITKGKQNLVFQSNLFNNNYKFFYLNNFYRQNNLALNYET